MAKFYGNITYVETVETRPGVWKKEKTVKPYRGELIKNTRRLENPGQVNDNIIFNSQISILCDAYAREHFANMYSVNFMGAEWKITGVEPQLPRLLLTIGGLAND